MDSNDENLLRKFYFLSKAKKIALVIINKFEISLAAARLKF